VKAQRIAASAAWVAAAALPIGLSPAAPLPATASAESCPDAEVVFARGTGEAPGVGRVGDAFVSALRSQAQDKSIGAYGVSYPASYAFLEAVNGANDASGHIQFMADNCPDTKLVLGGYSQGAAVMDIVTAAPIAGFRISQPLPADAAERVAAVVLFGNPSQRVGGMQTTLSPQYASKTVEVCSAGDPVCSDGGKWAAHTEYVPTGLTQRAAAFAAARL
jgi:cutinase